MFIDDCIEESPQTHVGMFYLKDAIVFNVEFALEDRDFNKISVASKDGYFIAELFMPPFSNMAIQYNFHIHGERIKLIHWLITSSSDNFSKVSYTLIQFAEVKGDRRSSVHRFHKSLHDNKIFLNDIFALNRNGIISIGDHDFSVQHVYLLSKIITIVNCQNIDIIQNDPPDKLQRKRIKKGKLPLVSWNTINIKQNKRYVNGELKNIWNNRIHICRGHYKYYSSEKPLFGKYTGGWWWQPMLRGKNKEGMVIKDYQIKAPE